MHAWIQHEKLGVMRRQLAFAFFCGVTLIAGGQAVAQAGGNASPGGSVAKPTAPAKAQGEPGKAPEVTIAGNFGQWALVCGKEKDKEGREPCSLVQALVQRESQKLVFRVTVAYGPQGNLVLRIDGPTGLALQKGPNSRPMPSRSIECRIRPACRNNAARFSLCLTISSRS